MGDVAKAIRLLAEAQQMFAPQQRRPVAPQDRGRILGPSRIQYFDLNSKALVRVYREWRKSLAVAQSLYTLSDR